jgi:ABC-type branched-subunit amino acid transport system substrate-binding protein
MTASFPRLLLLLLLVLGCAASPTPTIGVVSARGYIEAARMAFEDAMRADATLRVDTLFLSQSSNLAAEAVAIADQFLSRPGLAGVVGHVTSGSSLAVSQLYNDAQVVQLSPTATSVLYSQAGPFSYRMVPPDDAQGRFLADVLARDYPAGTRLALMYVNDDYGRGLRADVRAALDSTRYPLVLDLPHSEESGSDELATLAAAAVAAARPDVVLFLGSSTSLRTHLRALRQQLGNIPILGSDAVSSWGRSGADSLPWGGVRFVDFVDIASSPELRAFAARYTERTGLPATGPDALTYDAVRVLLEAIRSGATTGEAMRAYLASLGRTRPAYTGLTGPLEFTVEGNPVRSYVLVTIPERSIP